MHNPEIPEKKRDGEKKRLKYEDFIKNFTREEMERFAEACRKRFPRGIPEDFDSLEEYEDFIRPFGIKPLNLTNEEKKHE